MYIATDNKFIINANIDLMSPEDLAPHSPFQRHINTVAVEGGYMQQTVKQTLPVLRSQRSVGAYRLYALAEMLREEKVLPDLKVNPATSHPVIASSDTTSGNYKGPESCILSAREAIKRRMDGEERSPAWDVKDLFCKG